MSKIPTAITLSKESKDWAKQNIQNLSEWVERKLKEAMETFDVNEDELLDIEADLARINEVEVKIGQLKQQLIINAAVVKTGLADRKFKDVPEVQALTSEQLKDNMFMQSLVGVLRVKYPQLARIDVNTIRDYIKK